ncbi:fimbria/pilus periplasmic chaperone, partial [Streptomyces sp. S9]|nr:fimbria/pilus periplasmic chaperone [Streptomyces sp. S9]
LCRKKRWAALALAVVSCGLFAPAQAEVTIAGTRVVYPAQQREVAVKLNNVGARPALVQVWVDDGDPKQSPDTSKAPFLVSPPVVRIEPGKGQALRLVYGPTAA